MSIFKPHPASLVGLIDMVAAHEHALALWGFLEITHQQLYGNASALSPALQAIGEASRQEGESVLAISRRLDDLVEALGASYFDAEEASEEERYEAVAWARGQRELDPEIADHLWDFKVTQLLLEKAREHGYA
jgi:hypothetical protein